MATTLFKQVNYSAGKLISEIESGEIRLPDIQRPYVWKKTKARDLFDSMYHGFPVGYLLFWATGAGAGERQIGGDGKQANARLLIIDGQQRLTSLFAVINGQTVVNKDYEETRIQIAFRPRDTHFSVADAATAKDPEYINDVTELWAGNVTRTAFVRGFLERLRNHRDVSISEGDELSERIDRLFDVRNYPFTAMELDAELDEEKVAEVFVRINSQGTPLKQADFILTLMSVFWDEGRRQLEAFSKEAKKPSTNGPSPFNHFIQPAPDQLLRVCIGLGFRRGKLRTVYSLLRGKDLESGKYAGEAQDKQFAVLKTAQNDVLNLTNWHEFLKILIRAGFRSSSMVTSETALLYSYVIYLVAKRDFGVDSQTLREVMARWFFAVLLTGRYTGTAESMLEKDLATLSGADSAADFVSRLDNIIDNSMTADFWSITLPGKLKVQIGLNPALFAYYAALNLLGARVLFSKLKIAELFDPALKANKAPMERHHLFPKSYLQKSGVTKISEINQIANYALVEWPDNTSISDKAPSEYWPKFSARFSETDFPVMRFWHALPEGWEKLEYQDFLEQRRKLIANVIREGFERLKSGNVTEAESLETEAAATIEDLASNGENAHVEFKASARWNIHSKSQDDKIEKAIVKTVAGFLNAGGGTLLIGVNDEGDAVGLDNDYELLRRKDADGFESWLSDLFQNNIGLPAAANTCTSFHKLESKEVCRIDVKPSDSPVFVKPPKGPKTTEFFIRLGNSTRLLGTDEALKYAQQHWD